MSLVVRASRAPTAAECPGSIALAEIAPREIFDEDHPASVGSVVHAALAKYLRGEGMNIKDQPKDCRYPVWVATQLWTEGKPSDDISPLSGYLDGQLYVEYPVKDGDFTGHLDVASWNAASGTLVILDWKSGWSRLSHWPQLGLYADLFIRQEKVTPKKILLMVAFPRHFDIEWREVTSEDLETLKASIEKNIVEAEGWLALPEPRNLRVFVEGSHCLQCSAKSLCPAKRALIRPVLDNPETQLRLLEEGIHELQPADLARAYVRLHVVQDFTKTAMSILKHEVVARGGISMGDGKVLAPVPSVETEILFPKCAEWLKTATIKAVNGRGKEAEVRLFPHESDLTDLLELPKGKLVEWIGKIAPHGFKGAVEDVLLDELEARFAVRKTPKDVSIRIKNEEKPKP